MPNGSEISPAVVAALSAVKVANSTDIDDFFQKRKSQHYVKWFNSTLAGKVPWENVKLVDTPQNDGAFHKFWDQIGILFGGDASIIQFVALMSIIANEAAGNFLSPPVEGMGRKGHRGMAYLFDAIEGLKRSYNQPPENKTAFECFNNANYVSAHGAAPLAHKLARTTDARWSGKVWPSEFEPKPAPAKSAFIMEADFMKFRGRGFIQTTSRANYVPLIQFVQAHAAGNATIDSFKLRWAGKTPDQIAFESTNADWDRLFQQTDLIVAVEAVRVHNKLGKNYLASSDDPSVLHATGRGSLFHMGATIAGRFATAYISLFKQRVAAVLSAI